VVTGFHLSGFVKEGKERSFLFGCLFHLYHFYQFNIDSICGGDDVSLSCSSMSLRIVCFW
jgi:hypothetical protein